MNVSGARKMFLAAPLLAALAWGLSSARAAELAPTAGEAAVEATSEQPAVATEVSADAPADLLLIVNNCTYYNNAQHSQVVGQFGYDCCNNPVSWGRKTRYSSCGGCFPCFPPPPQ